MSDEVAAKDSGESRQPLSDVQLEIMNFVWDRTEATVGDIWRELSARRGVSRNTVGTLVQRLEDKGWLVRRPAGNAFVYRAATPRQPTVGAMVQRLVQSAFAGSVEGMVVALLDGRRLSAAEAKRIRNLIDRAERKKS